jgi:peptide subunit release factor 1 (eRF1)
MNKNIPIKTLTRSDVEELMAIDTKNRRVFSFYLGVRADRDFLAVANALLSEKEKELREDASFTTEEVARTRKNFALLEQDLRLSKLPKRTRTFIVFDDCRGTERIYKVPVYIPSRLHIGRDWYVHPFFKQLQRYPRYLVVLLSRDRARLLEYFWGEFEEAAPEIKSEVPQRMNAARATWKGLEENKIQNHIEVHIDRHLSKVAAAAEDHMRTKKLPYLILASHRELVSRFEQELSRAVRSKIIGSYPLRTDQSLSRIKEKSRELIDEFERWRERETIAQLQEGSSKKQKGAVLGLPAVLEELEHFRVHLLVIGKNFMDGAHREPDEREAGLGRAGYAQDPSSVLHPGDIVDQIIDSAVRWRIRIVHLMYEHPEFDPYGIGAILK